MKTIKTIVPATSDRQKFFTNKRYILIFTNRKLNAWRISKKLFIPDKIRVTFQLKISVWKVDYSV